MKCSCPIPNQYLSVCAIPNHEPRVIGELSAIEPSRLNEHFEILDELVHNGSLFVRIAGLSGVSAVAMGAYGAHSKYLVNTLELF